MPRPLPVAGVLAGIGPRSGLLLGRGLRRTPVGPTGCMSFDEEGRDPCSEVIGRDPARSGALRGRRSEVCEEGVDDRDSEKSHELGRWRS